MRVPVLLLSLVAVTGGVGCEELTTVVIPAESEVEVPGGNILAGNPLVADQVFPAGALSEALAQSINQTFNTAGYNKDAVDSLKLTKLTMTVERPDEGNRQVRGLGFIEKLTISVGAEGVAPVIAAESEDGAFGDENPGPAAYDMPTTGAELVTAFKAGDALDMSAELEPADPPTFATTVRFNTELTILVNVVGALGGL